MMQALVAAKHSNDVYRQQQAPVGYPQVPQRRVLPFPQYPQIAVCFSQFGRARFLHQKCVVRRQAVPALTHK
jgi:hypothetical protein